MEITLRILCLLVGYLLGSFLTALSFFLIMGKGVLVVTPL